MPRAGSKYGGTHPAERAAWQARLDAGAVVACWRCGRCIPREPRLWQLGHRPSGPSLPEHPRCNMSAGGRIGAAITNAKRIRRTRPLHTRTW